MQRALITTELIAQDAAASAQSFTVVANTTTGCLDIKVTGETSKTISWLAVLDTVEIVG